LLVAGAIEGFVSAGSWPLPARIAVSAGSVVFLALYLWNGVRTVNRQRSTVNGE